MVVCPVDINLSIDPIYIRPFQAEYFEDEYEAHINEKRCPALSCKELIAYTIDPAKCKACMICARKCPLPMPSMAAKT